MTLVQFLLIWPIWFVPARLTKNWIFWIRIPYSIFYITMSLYTMLAHIKCSFTDPGTIPKRSLQIDYPHPSDTILSESEGMRYCTKCENPKSVRAHHCSQCNRCILKMDHHCPWMNNCVGMKNMKFFILFLTVSR